MTIERDVGHLVHQRGHQEMTPAGFRRGIVGKIGVGKLRHEIAGIVHRNDEVIIGEAPAEPDAGFLLSPAAVGDGVVERFRDREVDVPADFRIDAAQFQVGGKAGGGRGDLIDFRGQPALGRFPVMQGAFHRGAGKFRLVRRASPGQPQGSWATGRGIDARRYTFECGRTLGYKQG